MFSLSGDLPSPLSILILTSLPSHPHHLPSRLEDLPPATPRAHARGPFHCEDHPDTTISPPWPRDKDEHRRFKSPGELENKEKSNPTIPSESAVIARPLPLRRQPKRECRRTDRHLKLIPELS
ncbi:hypothetical protein BT67DRAFT_464220 [Trichocladium antarcticum]|uniref:Uncharacterized protein n=1 Tax=Trichocladium antarcticum TaxID=1450529 RepID=A0AAN6UEE1_9PEZI|nr:hypothetical protein BT67DRAFT_464220 [Trichocladium antarcticum]